jgi:hypothetical protein
MDTATTAMANPRRNASEARRRVVHPALCTRAVLTHCRGHM